jgi:ABC-2 type transport system ATP-binding protein
VRARGKVGGRRPKVSANHAALTPDPSAIGGKTVQQIADLFGAPDRWSAAVPIRRRPARYRCVALLDAEKQPEGQGCTARHVASGVNALMRILAGVIRSKSGQAIVGGFDLVDRRGRAAYQRTLGYLPQELGLYPDLTGWEFLDYIGLLKGMRDRAQRRRMIDHLLETVSLTPYARRRISGYSGGMKRRLGIAQALVNQPRLLIVDEPTAGLDPVERIRFRNLLVELAGDRTVLLSTHIVEDVAQTCSRLTVLIAGRVGFQGAAADLVRAAAGQVWLVEADRPPAGDAQLVATVSDGRTTRYRVLAERPPAPNAKPAEPVLEDGYVALLRARA